jgi:K+-sensing histidine kinase KdpD
MRKAERMPEKQNRTKPEGRKSKDEIQNDLERLRALAHDLSNSLEAIMQASYLLSQAKLDTESKRWAQLLQTSSDEAAKVNREIRKRLRAMSEE